MTSVVPQKDRNLLYHKIKFRFPISNLMYLNSNYDPEAERLTLITIEKPTLLDNSFIFMKANLIPLILKFIFYHIDEVSSSQSSCATHFIR